MEKQETLASLYSLRAGMSYVSQQNDKVKKYENALIQYDEDKKAQLEEVAKTRKAIQKKITSKETALKRTKTTLTNTVGQKNTLDENIEKTKKKRTLKRIAVAGLCVVACIAFIVAIIFLNSWDWAPTEEFSRMAILACCAVVCFGSLWLSYNILSELSFSKKSHEAEIKNSERYNENTQGLEVKIVKDLEEIEELRKKVPASNAEAVIEATLTEKRNAYEKKNLPVYNEAINTGKITIKALELQSVLDPRDWENLDLIIFYLETGRADTIKEALQLVDREKQMNALVNAVENASREISGTIENSVARLGQLMTVCFDRLSQQMTQCFNEQNRLLSQQNALLKQQGEQLSELSEATKTSNGYLAQVASQQQVQSAFLEKISCTSLSLAKDVQAIRYASTPYAVQYNHTSANLN